MIKYGFRDMRYECEYNNGLGQRRRRWANIEQTLAQCLVLLKTLSACDKIQTLIMIV